MTQDGSVTPTALLPCPLCGGPVQERAEKDPQPNEPIFWKRLKFWFDCTHCAGSWECCGICNRGSLVEGSLWGEPGAKRLACQDGCGWTVSWRLF